MQVYESDNYFEIQFDYNQRIIADVKRIPGRFFMGTKKCWAIPKDQKAEVDNLMRKYMKVNHTAVEPEIISEVPPMPDLSEPLPLVRQPYPYQSQGMAYGIINKRFFNGDEPGLGKTTQAIGTAIGAGSKCILVICPSSLKYNWQKEWQIVAGRKSIILTDSIKKTWTQYYNLGLVNVFIVNYESLKKYFVKDIVTEVDPKTGKKKPLMLKHIVLNDTINYFDHVIIDEIHRCKDGSTQQSKFVMGICKGKEYVQGLSGTIVVNKTKDLISQLHIIGRLPDLGGYKYFMDRYCGGNGSKSTNLRELNYKLSSICFFQRKKKDVLKDLPDKMRQIILCDISNQKEYDDAMANLKSYLQQYRDKTDAEVQRSMQGEVIVRIGILKNIAARGKMRDVIEQVDEIIESGEKIGVFVHQKEIAAALKANYPHALSITGDDSSEDRNRSVEEFQNNPDRKVIILSIKAAGVGLTLTSASRCLFVELPWHAADTTQCEDRFHRIGQKDSVQCMYMLGKETIDEDIYELIEAKREIANTVTGNNENIQKEIIDRMTTSLFGKK